MRRQIREHDEPGRKAQVAAADVAQPRRERDQPTLDLDTETLERLRGARGHDTFQSGVRTRHDAVERGV